MPERIIAVKIGTSVDRRTKNISSSKPVREILEENDIDYGVAQISLDGDTIKAGSFDKSLDELGITGDRCMIIAVVKTENA